MIWDLFNAVMQRPPPLFGLCISPCCWVSLSTALDWEIQLTIITTTTKNKKPARRIPGVVNSKAI